MDVQSDPGVQSHPGLRYLNIDITTFLLEPYDARMKKKIVW